MLTMHLPLGLPSHLSSLLPFLNVNTKKKKKATLTSNKMFSLMKTSACSDGSLKNQSKTNQTNCEFFTHLLSESRTYRRTAFNCENLIIANCEFF